MKISDEEVAGLTKICLNKYCASLLTAYPAMEGAVRAILSELPEPTGPSWATPEAKAVLDHLAEHDPSGENWWKTWQAYRTSLKPKMVTLPERWMVDFPTGGYGICETEGVALHEARRTCGYIRPIPARTVPAEGK